MAPSLASTITSRIADTTLGLFLTTSEVTAVDRVTEHYTEVVLTADGFRSANWSPGHKLQLRPGTGTFAMRTYTPMVWDGTDGSTRILAYSHGDGPGAAWFRGVEVGDRIEAFGPRRSVDLGALGRTVVFVGDETTVGLAAALRHESPTSSVAHVLEANEPDETAAVLARYSLDATSTVLVKADGTDAVIAAVAAAVGAAGKTYDLVLSGDAATVAAVRRWVKAEGHSPGTTKAKAYWAAGRTGLD